MRNRGETLSAMPYLKIKYNTDSFRKYEPKIHTEGCPVIMLGLIGTGTG